MIAPDPFKTEVPMSERARSTYRAIAARMAALHPPIYLDRHIAQRTEKGKTEFSSLDARDSTLDGVNFIADDPKLLASALYGARDRLGEPALASMKENPEHWALKASFGKTVGTGWREIWRESPFNGPDNVPKEPGRSDNMFRMRFGTAGTPIRFTALHCAVSEGNGKCNIHVDESGFVLATPKGVSLTPDLYDHIVNELKWKTEFRDWLSGLMPNETAAKIVKEVVRRVSITFPNAANGYADLDRRINSVRRPRTPGDLLVTAGKIIAPVGVTVDVYEKDSLRVQVTGSIAGGDRTITLSVGGEW